MEVNAVVEAALREVDEIRRRARHTVEENLSRKSAHSGLKLGDRVFARVCRELRQRARVR